MRDLSHLSEEELGEREALKQRILQMLMQKRSERAHSNGLPEQKAPEPGMPNSESFFQNLLEQERPNSRQHVEDLDVEEHQEDFNMPFSDSGYNRPWLGATPREWQKEALEAAMKIVHNGKANVIRAATGSGKSLLQCELVFRLRCYSYTKPNERILLTVPTQRLVRQMYADMHKRSPASVSMFYEKSKKTAGPIIICCHASLPKLAAAIKKHGLVIKYWVADECHQTNGKLFRIIDQELQPLHRIGFTATPFLGTGDVDDPKSYLYRWGEEVFRYDIFRAVDDGCIMRPTVIPFNAPSSMTIDDAALWMIENHTNKRWGAVNAINIKDAEAFAEYANKKGYRAAAIHSKLSTEKQTSIMRSLRDGKIQFVVYVNLLAEGVDYPFLGFMVLRRPPAQLGLNLRRYIQEVGRVLRFSPETIKTQAVICDIHGVLSAATLSGDALLSLIDGTEDIDVEVDEEVEEDVEAEEEQEDEEQPRETPTLQEEMVFPSAEVDIWIAKMVDRLWADGCPACDPFDQREMKKNTLSDKVKNRIEKSFEWLASVRKDNEMFERLRFHRLDSDDWNALRWLFVMFHQNEMNPKRAHLALYIFDCMKNFWFHVKPKSAPIPRHTASLLASTLPDVSLAEAVISEIHISRPPHFRIPRTYSLRYPTSKPSFFLFLTSLIRRVTLAVVYLFHKGGVSMSTKKRNTHKRILEALSAIYKKHPSLSTRQISIHLGMSDGYVGKYQQIAAKDPENKVAMELADLLERFANDKISWLDMPQEFAKGEKSNRRVWSRPGNEPQSTPAKKGANEATKKAVASREPAKFKDAAAPVVELPKKKRGRPPKNSADAQYHATPANVNESPQASPDAPVVAPDYRTIEAHPEIAVQREVRIIMSIHRLFDLQQFFTFIACGYRDVIHQCMNGLLVSREKALEALQTIRREYSKMLYASGGIKEEYNKYHDHLRLLGSAWPPHPTKANKEQSKQSAVIQETTPTKPPEPAKRGRPRKSHLNGAHQSPPV